MLTIIAAVIAAFVVIPIIISLLTPKAPTVSAKDPENLGDSVPKVKDGKRLPVVFGRVLIKDPAIIWWGDNFSIPIQR